MRFDSNFRNVRHLESINLHDERMDIVSSLFCDPALHEEGRRVQSDWQRNTYTHHTNSMSRATCSLVLHRFGGRASQEPLQKKKRKNARNQVFPRERNSSPRHAYTRRAMGNEQRDFRAEATDSASRYSNPFLIHLFLLYVRDYSSIGSHSGKRCSTRIECESTRSDLFRLRIVRHSTTTLKSSNQRVDHVRTNIEQRSNEESVRSSNMYIVYRILENIFHDIV